MVGWKWKEGLPRRSVVHRRVLQTGIVSETEEEEEEEEAVVTGSWERGGGKRLQPRLSPFPSIPPSLPLLNGFVNLRSRENGEGGGESWRVVWKVFLLAGEKLFLGTTCWCIHEEGERANKTSVC